MKLIRTTLALAAATIAAVSLATTVSAHARYKSSTPGTGEVVQTAPARLDLFFTTNIQKVSGTYDVQVQQDRGPSVNAGPVTIDENDRSHVTVLLAPDLSAGRYVVRWKNVSDDDGDPATGAFSFYIQTPPTAVDLQADRQLETIGAEEETPSSESTAGSATAAGGSPTATSTRAASPSLTATASASSDGNSNTGRNVTIIVIAVIAIVAIGGGIAYAVRDRMRP